MAFDGYLLGKPAVLFAQIDFHHAALNVADLGAEAALARLVPGVAGMRFMDVAELEWTAPDGGSATLWVSRSGYTGEDGFEISVPEGAVSITSGAGSGSPAARARYSGTAFHREARARAEPTPRTPAGG